jgi:dihydrofolate synthase/folylpolyglutamate synthase
VDAAHNPHGARALEEALRTYFSFDELVVVFGVLTDKDAEGIIDALAPVASRFTVTRSHSDRAVDVDDLAGLVVGIAGQDSTFPFDSLELALEDARAWASDAPRRAVIVTGSITLVGEAIAIAHEEGWK